MRACSGRCKGSGLPAPQPDQSARDQAKDVQVEEETPRASASSALDENLSRDSGYDSLNGIGLSPARNEACMDVFSPGLNPAGAAGRPGSGRLPAERESHTCSVTARSLPVVSRTETSKNVAPRACLAESSRRSQSPPWRSARNRFPPPIAGPKPLSRRAAGRRRHPSSRTLCL